MNYIVTDNKLDLGHSTTDTKTKVKIKKNLVYYVIGGTDLQYVNLLEKSLKSLLLFPNNHKYDILVFCDEIFKESILQRSLPIQYLCITTKNPTNVIASMRKLEIFRFPFIKHYDKVLYLDCDIICNGSFDPLFKKVIDPTKIYVKIESTNIDSHNCAYYLLKDRPYTETDLAKFREKSICVFNAGQFAFRVSRDTRKYFKEMMQLRNTYNSKYHFYEQSFMNYYLNKNEYVNYDITDLIDLGANENTINKQNILIYHFSGCGTPFHIKLKNMNTLLNRIKQTLTK